MTRRRLGLLLLAGGMVVALFVAIVVFVQVSTVEDLRRTQPRFWVVVAIADVPERSVITASQVDVQRVPEFAVPAGAVVHPQPVSDLDEESKQALRNRVKDQYTSQRIYKGEIINRERLGASSAARPLDPRTAPSFEIPKGKVIYTLPVRLRGGNPPNDPVNIAILNAVRAGDFIDIYYTVFELPPGLPREQEERARGEERYKFLFTRRLLQNLQVLNVGFFPDPAGKLEPAGKDERFLTLLVDPDQALTLKWLKDVATLEGNMELVLRSPQDTDPFPRATMSYQIAADQFGLGSAQ